MAPLTFSGAMAELAATEPARVWWAASAPRAGALEAREPAVGDTRPLLLTFRGTVTAARWWFPARVAVQEWSHDPRRGVFIAVWDRGGARTCGRQSGGNLSAEAAAAGAPREVVEALGHSYTGVLTASNFGFAPGGAAPASFRLLEVLQAGAVPVITGNLLCPWEGAKLRPLDWDECVVRASSSEPALIIGVTYGSPPWGPGSPHALNPPWVTGGGGLDPPGALRHILRAGARASSAELLALGDLVRAVLPLGSATHAKRRAACAPMLFTPISMTGHDRRYPAFTGHWPSITSH
jgi:hypothetical protein